MTTTVAPTSAELTAAKAVVAAAENAASVISSSLGQKIDADVAALEARVKALETGVSAWFKANWPHIVTWGAVAGPALLTAAKAALKMV